MKAKFTDEADIKIASGSGGDGCVSFRRARFIPKGGPDGGDGGDGGAVAFFAKRNLTSLSDYTHRRSFKAESGKPGRSSRQHGKNGADLRLPVPVGTQVLDAETLELLADLDTEGMQVTVASGGRGGKGNVHYKSSVRQAPKVAQKGLPGQQRRIKLVCKLPVDVGVVGPPGSGKSTLLNRVTSAAPEIAAYPFTTQIPCMGVHTTETFTPLVFIEIPAIVSGSTQGAGLGSRYFKHLERAKILIFVLESGEDKTPEDYIDDFNIIQGELENYGLALSGKNRLVALNKADIFPDGTGPEATRAAIETALNVRAFWISSEKGAGLESMMEAVEALYGTNGDV